MSDTDVGYVKLYVNEFTEASAKEFFEGMEKARELHQPVVPVYIDSFGGSASALVVMLDNMFEYPGRVATIAMGKAQSAGAILLACGDPGLRFASENTDVMVHNVSGITFGKVQEMESTVEDAKRQQTQLFNILDQKCGKRRGYFIRELKKRGNVEWYMTSHEARSQGMVDHIRIPKLVFKSTVSVTLE